MADERDILMRSSQKVTVFGSGTFGTALGTVVARNGYAVCLLTRREQVAKGINENHRNPAHLSDFELPPNLTAHTCTSEALAGASFIVHCIPVQESFDFLRDRAADIHPDVPIVCTSKGMHAESLETMQDIVPRALGRAQPCAFLSGPTFASELVRGFPSGAALACASPSLGLRVEPLFKSARFRLYHTTDVTGVEVGGALKNVFALMAGAVEGMGFGHNTAAMLVTLACREMNQVAKALGADPATLSGLAGMGDLMLTCMGGQSRNRAVGVRLGKGEPITAILNDRKKGLAGVAEGVATAPAAVKLVDKHQLRTPMIRAVAAVIEGHMDVKSAVEMLLSYPTNSDLVVGDTL